MLLVTGANGILGREVCKLLKLEGAAFIPLVRRDKGFIDGCVEIDLTEELALEAFTAKGVKGVIHLAAAVPHSKQYPDSEKSARKTEAIDRNIHSFCEALGLAVVYASTCGLYDRRSAVEKKEDTDLIVVEGPYFAAKLAGEELFSKLELASILRFSAIVGKGQKRSVVLSRFIEMARSDQPITLWGGGTRQQNFVDARDAARITCEAIWKPRKSLVNVAAKEPVSMSSLAEEVIKTIGGGEVTFVDKADPREGEFAAYSISKAKDLFGWSPELPLEQSIAHIANEEFAE